MSNKHVNLIKKLYILGGVEDTSQTIMFF